LFISKSVILPVDNLYAEAIEAVKLRVALSASTPELILTFFFSMALQPLWGPGRYFGFLIYLRAVGLFGRVISSSQGLYLNTRQHKHRKTHIHTIKHPCPRRNSNPQSRPPSDRRLFMPQTARLPRPANFDLRWYKFLGEALKPNPICEFFSKFREFLNFDMIQYVEY
jgi:hypothetical protein